jgi:hypothetical protein
MRVAFTLGYPPAYEKAIRIEGNGKAPGGYVFRTRDEAAQYAASHAEANRYGVYAIILPRPFGKAATTDYMTAAMARHRWHTNTREAGAVPFMEQCGICIPRVPTPVLDCHLLVVPAPFINPDTEG